MKLRNLLLSFLLLALAVTANAQLTTNNAQRYYAEFKNYFVDDICTELKVPYSAMTDDQLRTTMSAMPQELVNIALKVKNNAWEEREKEFRVFEAKPYSNSYNWKPSPTSVWTGWLTSTSPRSTPPPSLNSWTSPVL